MKVTVDHGEYWDSPSSKMVQLYSMAKAAATKIPKGLNDPDLILMKVTVDHGEYWDSPSSKMVQLYSMAKAAATQIPKGVDENEKIDIQK
ncbi:unnamed protein product [Rotaria sp. Silwood1]|nr:unnamed protein product [Rotaria sp. Silwood1]